MTASDVIGLASQIFPKFANVAIVLSFNLKSEILSRVGVNATIADLGLRTSAKHDEAVVLHLTEVLALIEELYSHVQQPCQSQSVALQGLCDAVREPNLAATRLRSNLVACNKHYAAIRKGRHPSHKSTNVLDRLHKSFSNLNDHFKVLEETIKKKPPQDPEEYPQSVNGRLYRTLRQNLQCRCTQPCVDSHQHTRLCLSPEVQIRGQDIVFDFLFSNDVKSALAAFRWQQVRLFVSKKSARPKGKVAFSDDRPLPEEAPDVNDAPNTPEDFRRWLDQDHGAVWMPANITPDDNLHVAGPSDYGEPLEPTQSVSLTNVLLHYRLTGKMKLVLAYILAQSVWRYYNSDWMKTQWSTDSIHFLKIQAPDTAGTRLYACSPCFAVQFLDPQIEVAEFYDGPVAHKYLRLLALGNLLLDIGRQRPLLSRMTNATDGFDQRINNDCALSINTLKRDEYWPYFGTLRDISVRTKYKEITQACFDKKLFPPLIGPQPTIMSIRESPSAIQDAEERRGILYKQVVAPLAGLLDGLGWTDALRKIEPMEKHASSDLPTPTIEKHDTDDALTHSKFLESSSSMNQRHRSVAWLQQIQHKYRSIILQHSKHFASEHYTRIRIAVLDTGYDPQAEFFLNRDRRNRLREWKDWAAGSGNAEDLDGHGSRILSLLMKIAPMADMFVARIAKDSRGLEHSSQSIAEAIAWSSTECKADIICMSFGFNEEEIVANSKPVRQAIRQAALDRHERILLFAAAGNEGANLRHVMFPARHDLVIPIYGTDARGAFVEDLNPRIKRDGPAIFGTLAKDVPCAGLSDEAEVYASGTSFATAIAAGLAGMLLEYVQLLALKRRESDKEQHDWKAQLSTRRGMLAMFQQMAEQPPDRRYYLHPIHYFQQTEDARQASIVLAARSPN